MNMAPTIVPKSDQLNADDLISGPITVKIIGVHQGSKEQPVAIAIEGYEGRPYKPSKSMRRVLVSIWGNDASAYVGRRLTLYRDPSVRFGAELVGGIKISHASDIAGPQSMALTESRGKRKPHEVLPLVAESVASEIAMGSLPAAWPQWSNEERGDYMATQGTEKLKAWWATLDKADKKKLEPRLRNDWQPAAMMPAQHGRDGA